MLSEPIVHVEWDTDPGRPFAELSQSGLLWLINTTVFHPRGYALALHSTRNDVTGWSLIGDGTHVFSFTDTTAEKHYQASRQTLAGPERDGAIR